VHINEIRRSFAVIPGGLLAMNIETGKEFLANCGLTVSTNSVSN